MYRSIVTLGILIFLFTAAACAQTAGNGDSLRTNESRSMDSRLITLSSTSKGMIQAMEAQDFDKFADFILPEVITLSGGREKFISVLKETYGPIMKGFSSVKIVLQKPAELIELDKKLIGLVPFHIDGVIAENQNHVISKSHVVGVSTDDGKTWKFVSDSGTFFEVFPLYAGKIAIPKEKIIVNGIEQ